MTGTELELTLLRYNMLSKEKATAVHMYVCAHTNKSSYYNDKWEECIDEMMKMEDDLRKDGYEFVSTGIKTTSKTQYRVYKIVHVHSN